MNLTLQKQQPTLFPSHQPSATSHDRRMPPSGTEQGKKVGVFPVHGNISPWIYFHNLKSYTHTIEMTAPPPTTFPQNFATTGRAMTVPLQIASQDVLASLCEHGRQQQPDLWCRCAIARERSSKCIRSLLVIPSQVLRSGESSLRMHGRHGLAIITRTSQGRTGQDRTVHFF